MKANFFIFVCVFMQSLVFGDWPTETLEQMTLEQKIGQLFIVPMCPLRDKAHERDLEIVIEKYFIGGIIPKQSDPLTQIAWINRLQQKSLIGLLCVMDAENGIGMRMSQTVQFPKNLTLGAIKDEELLYALGRQIGHDCKKVGGHVNFAPVVDVNNNASNPIIHMRSFGEDPQRVARKACLLMQGLKAEGVLACPKHFPGHGDTFIDSHLDLPVLLHNRQRLEKVELYPFLKMIQAQAPCMMIGHLLVPSLDKTTPATLSYSITTMLLKKELGFKGLVFSDALNMGALKKHYSTEEIAIKAFLAGNDFLVYGDHIAPNVDEILHVDVPRAFAAIKRNCELGVINEKEIDARVLKILQHKEKLGLNQDKIFLTSKNILEEINSESAKQLKKTLYQEAVTLVSNPEGLLPLQSNAVLLEIGNFTPFATTLEPLIQGRRFSWADKDNLPSASHLIIAIGNVNPKAKNFGISEDVLLEIKHLKAVYPHSVIALFGTPYALSLLSPDCAILVGYEEDPDAQEAVAEALMGRFDPHGELPISASKDFPIGTSISY